MAKPLIHFPMDEDELLDLINVLKDQVSELEREHFPEPPPLRGKLLLLQIRLSATYKELSDMTGSRN